MRFSPGLIAVLAVVSLAGCASNRYCTGVQKYQNAENLAPLEPMEGLSLPESPTALRIPAKPATSVPFGFKDKNGNGVCLDKPPAIVTSQPAPPPLPNKKKS